MRKRYQLIISTFLIASIAALIQFSLISSWPTIFNEINLALIILIFALFFFGRPSALLLALFFGFWLDFLSFTFFGLYLISFFLVVLITDRILGNWLTNRSLYSFLTLTITANIVYSLCFYLFLYLSRADRNNFFLGEKSFWLASSWQIIWSLLAALLLFNLAAALTKKLKPFFLENK